MGNKPILLATTCLIGWAVFASAPVQARDVAGGTAASAQRVPPDETKTGRKKSSGRRPDKPRETPAADGTDQDVGRSDIVVVGIRGSTLAADQMKRDMTQITDSIVAEDAGKLPDNNVPEALARVPGVQIDRSQGEGSQVTIRGMSDIQTTINGQDIGQAGSRSVNLADIPADLIKSVTVYKTRSADQIEGGIAGTVNVELRRALDLKKGLTVAASLRTTYSDIGKTKSPYASLLVSNRFDTGIGEMGLLVNASYTQNNYEENYVVSESPQKVVKTYANGSPTYAYFFFDKAIRDTIVIPFAVNSGVEKGSKRRPSVNVSYQWKPSDRLNFILEGQWIGLNGTSYSNNLNVNTNNAYVTYTDAVMNDEGTVKSVTINGLPFDGFRDPNGGAYTTTNKSKSNTYNANFETHWNSDIANIDFATQYVKSDNDYYYVTTQTRFLGATSIKVDFDSPNVPGGGPFVQFRGTDISDPARAGLGQIHDQIGINASQSFASRIDLTLKTSEGGLLRSIKTGYRFTTGKQSYDYGYRDAFAPVPTFAAVSAATGIRTATTTPNVRGATETATWAHLDYDDQFDKFNALRNYFLTLPKINLNGNNWTTERPTFNDLGSAYRQQERTSAAYGILNYGFKAIFPIDGQLGLRYINTWGSSSGTNYTWRTVNGAIPLDAAGKPIYTLVTETNAVKANYVDLLPSATAIVRFTPDARLRLSYTHNVTRPGFGALRNFLELRGALTNPNGVVFAGNPELKPIQDDNYSASFEFNFNKSSLFAFAPFLKKQKGFIYNTQEPEFVAELGRVAQVSKPRNAGPGTIAGFESQFNTVFSFLPGPLKHLGILTNFTYIPKARLQLNYSAVNNDIPHLYDAPFTSKYSGNAILTYDTPVLSARVAYNYRSSYKRNTNFNTPGWSIFTEPTQRLDAAVNVTPFKFLTLSVEATNLMRNFQHNFYGAYKQLPVGARQEARVFSASARVRF